ncbi:unnamed protein product [Effrenium voratum]|nr:unnamed protein product [Effrenium voratum]
MFPGADAPTPPRWSAVFKAAWKKNLFLGVKRGRFISAPFNVCIQMGFTVMMWYIFKSVGQETGSESIRRWLMAAFMPLNTLIGIVSGMNGAIVDIIGEKEQKMKIIQNIYGMSESLYWSTWFFFYALIAALCIVIIFIFWSVVIPVLETVNFLIFFIILTTAYAQTLLLVLVGSVLIDKQRTADLALSVTTIMTLCITSVLQYFLQTHQWLGFITGSLPFTSVFQALTAMLYLSAAVQCDDAGCQAIGATWDTLFLQEFCMVDYHPTNFPCIEEATAKIFPLGWAMIFMVASTFLMVFLVWWLSNVWQGHYGAAKPLCFCFLPRYMCASKPERVSRSAIQPDQKEAEAEQPVLSIQNLRKEFAGKVAVDGLSLDVYRGEIFALLGHNGAGKTTAFNCVVGLTPATSGETKINGHDVKTSLETARQQLSVCPQDNPMFVEFSVRQHLKFFSFLRGVSPSTVDAVIDTFLGALGLGDKADHPCGKLSGGQKRRLWVATALIGDSPIAFLDEPTSGMDPSSRRELWALLLRIRDTGRCIIFTTHYLEEADILAQRKAVLARGKVQAAGTSRELKQRFGVGYRLSLELDESSAKKSSPQQLEAFVQDHVKSAALEAHEEASTHVTLTMSFDDIGSFPELLLALDESQGRLGLADYALGMSSLEDVFMALGQQAEDDAAGKQGGASPPAVEVEQAAVKMESSERRQLQAVMLLRLLPAFKRSRVFGIAVLPVLIQLAGVYLARLGASADSGGTNGYAVALYPAMTYGIALITACQDIMLDNKNKGKYVSMSQGLTARAYWLGNFCAHLVLLLPTALGFGVIFLIFRPPSMPVECIPAVLLIILLFPMPLTLCFYNFTAVLAGSESVSKVVPLLMMMTIMLPGLLIWLLTADFMPKELLDVANGVHIAMAVLNPNYALAGMMAYLVNVDGPRQLSVGGYFSCMSVIPLYILPLTSTLCAANLMRLDTKSYENKPPLPTEQGTRIADEDVLAEEARCKNESDDAAQYQGLSHTYRVADTGRRPDACAIATREYKHVNAVKNISLGIRKGECFSLLGPNGAGKTTTLGILTGEIRNPSQGQVSIYGHNMAKGKERQEAFKMLGVCPQVDPLWEELSGEDHLRYFGRLKGVPEELLSREIARLLARLGLEEAGGKAVGTYSGGMKRKLSVGIALIGHPQMLFLDEPSAAVDAGAKRHLWKVIKHRGPDQTVVLTTHSMEEAEALSSRMAIQVTGQLRCLGTPMHIKHKYGSGYQLELVAQGPVAEGFPSKQEELTAFVQSINSSAELLEANAEQYVYQLPPKSSGLKLGSVFQAVESRKQSLGISAYSVCQPSLEQVFLRFAKEQFEADREADRENPRPAQQHRPAAVQFPQPAVPPPRWRQVCGCLWMSP